VRLAPASLLWRTLAVLVAALVLSQATAFWLFDEYISQPRAALATRHFASHLKTVHAALQTMDEAQARQFIARIAEQDGIRILAVHGSERLRPAPDRPALRLFRERIRDTFGSEADVFVRMNDGDGAARARVLWVKLPAGDRQYWVSFPRTRIERDPLTAVIAWTLAGLALAVLGTFLIVWRLNRPLGELARAAGAVGRGMDPPSVPERGPAEIRALARAFNQMKDDLRTASRERATFLAGVSHDLRTPLARLRLDLEMLEGRIDGEAQRGMVSDVEDMAAIIDQFVDFARSEATEAPAAVDVAELAHACAQRAARSGIEVKRELGEVPVMIGRPLAMQRLLDNLIANAARHGGGDVTLRAARVASGVVLSVLDRGPGISSRDAERLKQPFTRGDDARSGASGAGLGLAIVERIARIHGGRLDLLPREGGGLEARVSLPAPA
jgi:two-component system osmolarity sensor histidine kinase EnvZ